MARDENDVTDGRDDRENAATARARRRALEGDAPPSAEAIGAAVAAAMERQRANPVPARQLPTVVRASVRCGYETTRRVLSDGSTQMVTAPASMTFTREETADEREHTVPHGRPIRLKLEAFKRYERDGKVVLAQ